MAKVKKNSDERGFEELLKETEEISERLESGVLSLDDSLGAYSRGVENLRRCAELLKNAEEKVKVLLEEAGSLRLEDLDQNDTTEDEG